MSVNESTRKRIPFAAALAFVVALVAVASFVWTMAAGILSPRQAFADEDATFTVLVQHGEGDEARNIDGMTLEIYEVARLGDAGYEMLPAYESVQVGDEPVNFNEQMSAKNAAAVAKELAGLVADQQPNGTQTTDANGTASFGQVEGGVYLIVQVGAEGTATEYTTLDPTLANVPQMTEDEVIYDVVVRPKATVKDGSTSSSSSSTTSSSSSSTTTSSSSSSTTSSSSSSTTTSSSSSSSTTSSSTPPSSSSSSAVVSRSPRTGDPIDWRVTAACTIVGFAALATALAAARRLRR